MTDGDDSATWLSSALSHAELAAHQIARFTNPWWDPTWHDLVPYDPPSPLAVVWATRGRRSRSSKKDAVAASSCSPATPLDFGLGSGSGSGATTSGGEDGFGLSKRRRVGDGGNVSGGWEMKINFPVAKDSQRTGKKKTLCELQEEERLLLENKNQLQKEMEMRMKAYEGLRGENQRLKNQLQCSIAVASGVELVSSTSLLRVSFHSERASVKSATARASFESPSPSSRFILPDLNEPLSENFN